MRRSLRSQPGSATRFAPPNQAASPAAEADNELWLSIASLWEITIKLRLGKLTVGMPIEVLMTEHLTRNAIDILPITVAHLMALSTLPLHHRDPFDRLLIAQAMVEQAPLVSADPACDAYPVQRVW